MVKTSALSVNDVQSMLRRAKLAEAEFAKLKDVCLIFGLSRDNLLQAIYTDKVKAIHVKQPGAKKGFYLLNLQSVRDYLATFEEGGSR